MPRLTLTVEVDDETAAWLEQTGKKDDPEYLGNIIYNDMIAVNKVLSTLATLFHDIAHPISAIKGYITLLLMGEGGEITETQKEFLSNIDHYSDNLGEILHDARDVMRIEANQTIFITFSPTDFNKCLEEVVNKYHNVIENKNQVFKVEIPKNIPQINADATNIKRAISNLLDNASKFTLEGGEIKIAVEVKNNLLYLSVMDNGRGIARENLIHIFERYIQGRKIDIPNANTGLFLAKHIIELHGGEIWIESEVGKGTTVHFTLPLA